MQQNSVEDQDMYSSHVGVPKDDSEVALSLGPIMSSTSRKYYALPCWSYSTTSEGGAVDLRLCLSDLEYW